MHKDGVTKGKQRYKCKQCKRTTGENGQRYKYSLSKRLKVLKGYLKRLEGVLKPLIIKWNGNYSKILKELIAKATVAKTIKNAPILVMEGFCYTVINFAVDRSRKQILGHCPGLCSDRNARFAGI